MPVIGITGGVASGKSTVTRMMSQGLKHRSTEEVESFSADECGHGLLEHDPAVRAEVVRAFGEAALGQEGSVNRTYLRGVVFEDREAREKLEAILHPRIHKTWRERCKFFKDSQQYFVAEIPLLYETNSALYFDCITVVTADADIQIQRLSSKRGWALETARRVIETQMPAEEKIRRANILILNHHTESLLSLQINLAVEWLLARYA